MFDGFVCRFDSVQCLMHLFVSLTLCSVCFGVFVALTLYSVFDGFVCCFDTVFSVSDGFVSLAVFSVFSGFVCCFDTVFGVSDGFVCCFNTVFSD